MNETENEALSLAAMQLGIIADISRGDYSALKVGIPDALAQIEYKARLIEGGFPELSPQKVCGAIAKIAAYASKGVQTVDFALANRLAADFDKAKLDAVLNFLDIPPAAGKVFHKILAAVENERRWGSVAALCGEVSKRVFAGITVAEGIAKE